MPQMQPLVLTDKHDPATPHTFIPKGQTAGVTTLVESTGTPLGDRRITISQVSNTAGRVKTVVKLALPVVQDATVNGVSRPTVVRTNYADITMNIDPGSNALERADLAAFISEIFNADHAGAGSKLKPVFVDLEGLY